MSADFSQNHFALFDLPQRFRLDSERLDQAWRAAAGEVHPDRYAQAGAAEKRVALMLATRINEAYRTLKSPLDRARYLLSLSGIDTREDTDTRMPSDFLMKQIEWREAIEEAQGRGDPTRLDALAADLQQQNQQLLQQLAQALDDSQDLDLARLLVRKCRFMEKLGQEIDEAVEALLS
jgi:molecular chaperone HscB